MLAYQHAYHVGNFADVHKHLILAAITNRLAAKDTPITYVDTHAGRGIYPLSAQMTQQLAEYRDAALPIWQWRERFRDDELIDNWLSGLELLNHGERLENYPGSPWWFLQALHPQDQLWLYDLHPTEIQWLSDNFQQLAGHQLHQLHFAKIDGLSALIKQLPVKTPRLAVLIDPSYEVKTDYNNVVKTIKQIQHKARHALVMLWYPVLKAERHLALIKGCQELQQASLWQSELYFSTANQSNLYGSGILIYNLPFQLEKPINNSFQRISEFLGKNCRYFNQWLTTN